MTTTATLMPDLSRVRVAFSGLHVDADVVKVERSVDGFNWVTVRGGESLAVAVGKLDDYEFVPGVVNTYRVTAMDTAIPSFVAAGTAASGNNTSPLAPGIPAGLAAGDAMVMAAAIRNSGTGAPGTVTGWTQRALFGNVGLYTRAFVPGDTAPSVPFTGGVAGADTMARIIGFRNLSVTPDGAAGTQLNASAQNITTPAFMIPKGKLGTIAVGWKQDDWSSIGLLPGFTNGGSVVSTAGDDAALVMDYFVGDVLVDSPYAANQWTVTGGAAAISRSMLMNFRVREFTNQETATITPTLEDSTGVEKVWVKNLTRPYANTPITTPVGLLTVEREARVGLFPVVGRSVAVAVTDKRLGKQFTIGAKLDDETEKDRLDAILSAGEVIYLHIPPGHIRLKSMYAVIGTSSYDDEAGIMWLPLTECAAPASTVSGATVTWADVIATYPTWASLIAAKSTWGDVLDIVGDPTDIITG